MTRQFATFFIGENLFGINVMLVREINRNLDITTVDRAPEYVCGLLNLRGQIVTVVDLAVKIGIGKIAMSDTARCIVMKKLGEHADAGAKQSKGSTHEIIGFLVDRIGDMVTVDSGQIESAPANVQAVDVKYTEGIVKLENNLLVLLKTGEIV